MHDPEQIPVEWVPREQREWVELAPQPDELSARMLCTYLEAAGIEARVTCSANGCVVEVPDLQYGHALQVYQPVDSSIAPPLEESRHQTSVHTGRRIKAQLAAKSGELPPRRSRLALLLVVLALAAAAVVIAVMVL